MNERHCAEVCKAKSLVMDACYGSISVFKAFMLPLKHRRSFVCKVNPSCVAVAMLQLISIYPSLVLSKKFDIDRDEKVRSSAKRYIKSVELIEEQNILNV